jgi:hypothetical protein
MTPEAAWNGRKVDLSHLNGFGCRAFRHAPDRQRKKWDQKSRELVHLGYSEESEVYRLIDSVTKKVVKARDVLLFEDQNVGSNIREEKSLTGEADLETSLPSTTQSERDMDLVRNEKGDKNPRRWSQ